MTHPIKQRKKNYVNNRDFFNALGQYQEDLKTNPNKSIPNYVGECIVMIAKKYSSKPNFSSYSYIDEMRSDAVENCFVYLDRFDPTKGENPFAYFTAVIHNAFIRRINEEHRQQAIKIKNMRRMISAEELMNNSALSSTADTNDITSSFIENYERKLLTNSKKNSKIKNDKVGIEKFIDGEKDVLAT